MPEQQRTSKPPKDRGRKAVEKKANQLERLKVEYVRCDSITPNPYNPNRQNAHDFELLQRSMREDGFTQPIIVQQATREIVDGEHRWRAAMAIGWPEIPVVFVDMTPEQMRISTLRHNRARGSEDFALTAQVLRDLQALGALAHAQDSLMLDDVELNRLLEDQTAAGQLAAAEYSQGWEPQPSGEAVPLEQDALESEGRAVAMSRTAVEQMREVERRVAAAKTDEERAAARKDADVYRLVLMFRGDEGKVVRQALGERPAEKLLTWCRDGKGA